MKSFENLKKYIKKISNGPDFDDGMAVVSEFILRCLREHASQHQKDIPALERFIDIASSKNYVRMNSYPKSSTSKNPFLGLCATRSPIWAQSPVSHANKEACEGYAKLVAYLVSQAVIVLRRKTPLSENYLMVLAAGFRGLRSLSEEGAAEVIFDLENKRYSSLEEAIYDAAAGKFVLEYSNSIGAVASMLKLIKGKRRIRTRTSAEVLSDRHAKWIHGNIDDFIYENSDEYSDVDSMEDSAEIMTVKDVGDDGEGIDFIIADVDNEKKDSKRRLPDKLRDRYQALNIGKANQKLAFAWSVLTPAEQGWLLSNIINKDFKGDVRGFLLLALLSGKDFEQLVQARVVSKDSLPEFEIEYVYESHQLRVKVKKPDIKSSHSRAFIKTESHTELSMPTLPSLNNDSVAINKNCMIGERLFDMDIFQAKEMVKKFLDNQPTGFRITFSKVRSFAASMFANHSTDSAIGALILDGVTPIQKTVRHYLTIPASHLRDQYEIAFSKAGLRFSSVSKRLKNQTNNKFVGTDYCLKESRLQSWIKAAIKNLGEYTATREQTIAYHNSYTLYTVMMFSHAALWRGNKTPIPDNFLCDNGFILMNDKAIGAGYSIRFNPLPVDVLKQLRNYMDHASRVKAFLNITSPRILKSSSDFFLLTEQGKPRPVRAGLLMNISPRFPGRRNALRIHMRSRLSELSIPGEVLDAAMGHWHNGIEPYSCYSSISPTFVQKKLLPAIEKVMKDSGWAPIKSLVLA